MANSASWDFGGQVVVVTGAARGQGRAHAAAFAGAGATLAICDAPAAPASVDYPLSDEAELERTAEELRETGAEVLSMALDVRDPDRVAAFFDRITDALGQVDVLVNNAGINAIHEFTAMPTAVWRDVLATNLDGVYHCSREAAKLMVAAGRGGRIISTGSVNSALTMPWNAAYTASKHAVAGLTKAMAVDLARVGITVNMVAPGIVDTTLLACAEAAHVPEDYFERLLRVGGAPNLFAEDEVRPLQAEEVTGAVLWLASEAARHITGATIRVDAGFAIT
ncbi:MAG: SDR family NAD(P)-dependent oxidoreductase [Solirubrobacterales bacterium]